MIEVGKHRTLPVEAPRAIWTSLRWTVDSDGNAYWPFSSNNMDELLALAVVDGLKGEQALAWAAKEMNRRYEVSSLNNGIHQEAMAIKELAASIRSESEKTVLDGILAKLSTATQYAVKAQLGRRN